MANLAITAKFLRQSRDKPTALAAFDGLLDGLLRTTLFTDSTGERARDVVPFDKPDDVGACRVFVQISELNALNAALAVIRYKQFRVFYVDDDAGYKRSAHS